MITSRTTYQKSCLEERAQWQTRVREVQAEEIEIVVDLSQLRPVMPEGVHADCDICIARGMNVNCFDCLTKEAV